MKIYALVAVYTDTLDPVVYEHHIFSTPEEIHRYLTEDIMTCDWWPLAGHYTWHVIDINTEEVEDG